MSSRAKKMGSSSKKERQIEELPVKREPYKFTAFVTGPLIEYEISGRDFEEVYATGMGLLRKHLEKYKGPVEVNKVEVLRYTDLPF